MLERGSNGSTELLLFRFDGENSFLEIIQIMFANGALGLIFRETSNGGDEMWEIVTRRDAFRKLVEWIPVMVGADGLIQQRKEC
jgi:hypothetical protein